MDAECVLCGTLIRLADSGRWVHMSTEEAECESVDPHANRDDKAIPLW